MENRLSSSEIAGLATLEILQKTQKDMQERNTEPEDFEDRIIFVSMFNDIEWTKRGNSEQCVSNSEKVMKYAKRFSRGLWTSLRPGDETKWYGTLSKTLERKWDSTATQMVERFKETGHPVFKSISALSRRILKRITETPYISMPIHRTPNSCSDSIFLWISSVFTEQSQAGCEEFGQRPNEKQPTSEQLLKNVKTEEVNSLVQTPRSDDPAAEDRLRECLQNFETREKQIQFSKSLRGCVILWKSLYWNVLQNRCRPRWWFWRPNSSMQKSVHTLVLIQIPEFMPQPRDEL